MDDILDRIHQEKNTLNLSCNLLAGRSVRTAHLQSYLHDFAVSNYRLYILSYVAQTQFHPGQRRRSGNELIAILLDLVAIFVDHIDDLVRFLTVFALWLLPSYCTIRIECDHLVKLQA